MHSVQTRGDTTPKPRGGYVQISTLSLGILVWANSQGLLSSRGLRVALALFENRARRTAHALSEKKNGRRATFTPHYSVDQLGRLCGLPTKRVRAALRELEALGFLAEHSPTTIRFATSLESLTLSEDQRTAFLGWFSTFTPRKRIPIPRRILVFACESASSGVMAVILGACLRCCWRKKEGFRYFGRLACTWLKQTFNVCLTAIKRAKTLLVRLGWLKSTGNVSRRFGELMAINPEWHRLATLPEAQRRKPQDQTRGGGAKTSGSSPGTKSDLEARSPGTKSDPPSKRETSPKEFKTQETPTVRPEGSGPGIFNPDPKKEPKTQAQLPEPRLSAIRPEDFKDVPRGLELFRQAVKCHLVENGSENSRLRFFAAIEKARTVPAKNPAGLFLWVLKGKHWDHLSEGHFEAASRRLKAALHERPPGVPPLLVARTDAGRPTRVSDPDTKPRFSKDALLVKTIRDELARRGQSASVFSALHTHGGWDRTRYAAAIAELETPQICQPTL